ncbi:hypothetical protein AJ78_01732 [Emergomyces pasteurianus Ep9510]|uniref:Uncharacterized protein n=1 Tax=Emergomyces pasteurianus Ep9510 TaxID=1447872 RepID=A0A1J9PP24_9EURO|nr:hypothetical protein AJ78_01732 [Emergomyces pasteurianus Ep9510]
MRFCYSFIILNGIAATVLSAPIRDAGGLTVRTEQGSKSLVARVVNPLYITPSAARKPRHGSVAPLLEDRGNERRQDRFGYSHYDSKPEMDKRQFDHNSYAAIDKMKSQGDFGYSDYDDKPMKERRQFDYASYDKPENSRRQDSFGYSDYDDKPEKERRQFGYDDYDISKERKG